jgi:hypothetical protein
MPQKPPDLDEFGNPVITKPPDLDANGVPQQTGFQRDWKTATTPLTTKPAEWGRNISDIITNPTLATSATGEGGLRDFAAINTARMKGFYGGMLEGAGNVVSEMTSPLNLLTMGLGTGEYAAGKLGLTQIARALGYGTKAASAPFAIHGGAAVINPESTLSERGMGLAEAAGGAAGMLHTPAGGGKIKKTESSAEVPVDMSWFESEPTAKLTQLTPVQSAPPIRPVVNPAVSKPVIEPLKTGSQSIENTPSLTPINTTFNTIDDVHTAYNAGQINQEQALKAIQKIYKSNVKAIKTTKSVEPIEATMNEPVSQVQAKTYIFKKEEVTPDFIAKAREQGYDFDGLTDKGDYRFSKIPGESTTPVSFTTPLKPKPKVVKSVEPIKQTMVEPVVEPPITEVVPPVIKPTAIAPEPIAPIVEPVKSTPFTESVLASEPIKPTLGIPEVVELMRSGQVKNMAELQKELGISFNETRVIWQAAKDAIGPKDYSAIQTARKAVVPELKVKQPGVPPVAVKPKPVVPPKVEPPSVTSPISEGTVVIPKEKVTPDFIRNARAQGYMYDSLTENGDFVFREAPPVLDLPPSLMGPEPIPTKSVVTKTSKSVETKTGIPVTETGNTDLDGMVASLRAMRRRKGINQYTELEAMTYRGLLESIKNHPDLPPHMKEMWDKVTTPAETAVAAPTVEAPVIPTKVAPKTAAQIWADKLTELDTQKAPDEAYRAILSAKAELKPGETWRGKVEKLISMAEEKAKPKPGGGFGSRFRGEKGELTIDLSGPKPKKPVKETLENFPANKIVTVETTQATPKNVKVMYDAGFRFIDTNEKGQLRFQKKEIISQGPILEEEIGIQRPTKQGIKKENFEGQLGVIQDAQKASAVAEAFNLPRGTMAAIDLSFPLRQGLPFIHKKEYWKAMIPMFKSWGSEEGFRASQASIAERPLFKKRLDPNTGKELPSFADDAGLKLTDLVKENLTNREEAIMSTWAESGGMFNRNKWMARHGGNELAAGYQATMGKGVRASNRAYTAFANNLRADVFESMIKDAKVFGIDTKANLVAARQIADFVNTFTGRGSLGKLESSAVALNTAFFAPRLMISRVKILTSPFTYMMTTPQLRKETIKSLLAITTFGSTVLGLAKAMGAEVSLDPTSSDFGKAKIGNLRLDPWGGFQQYVVATSKLLSGTVTSSTSGKQFDLSNPRGPYGQTHMDVIKRFARGKTNPVVGFAIAMLDNSTEMSGQKMNFKTPNPMENSVAQRFIPLLMQDIYNVAQDDPTLLPLAIPATFGMGMQTYGNIKR